MNKVLDHSERVVAALIGGWLLYRLALTVPDRPYNLLIMASEAASAAFIIIRRPGVMSVRAGDWLAAAAGTFLPMLVMVTGTAVAPGWVSASLMGVGLGVAIAAKLFLRRSFGIAAANRGVKRGGPYKFVRHPMYLGYMVSQIGLLLEYPTLWNAALYVVAWSMQVVRIEAEERVLGEDAAYRAYCQAVRFRLVPGIF